MNLEEIRKRNGKFEMPDGEPMRQGEWVVTSSMTPPMQVVGQRGPRLFLLVNEKGKEVVETIDRLDKQPFDLNMPLVFPSKENAEKYKQPFTKPVLWSEEKVTEVYFLIVRRHQEEYGRLVMDCSVKSYRAALQLALARQVVGDETANTFLDL